MVDYSLEWLRQFTSTIHLADTTVHKRGGRNQQTDKYVHIADDGNVLDYTLCANQHKKCPLVLPRFSHKACLLHLQLQCPIAWEFITKFTSGRGEREAFSAEECGWKATDDQLAPLMTHLQPASGLLDCSSMRWLCRKHNLECYVACGALVAPMHLNLMTMMIKMMKMTVTDDWHTVH